MTAGSLPEGLVERCLEAARSVGAQAFGSGSVPDAVTAYWSEVVRAVLAVAAPELRAAALREYDIGCHAGKDGECTWPLCPQNREGEPMRSGRHCPIDWPEEVW